MIRAAIVGMGRWGRTLIGSVQGKSEGEFGLCGLQSHPRQRRGFCTSTGSHLRTPR